MSQMRSSPGPWSVRSGVAIDDAKGRWIASAAKGKNWITEGERQANAQLMAAAPELWRALFDLHRLIPGSSPFWDSERGQEILKLINKVGPQ
jgi:hypothetical protein